MNTLAQLMIHVSDDLVFNLSNQTISYIFRVSPEGILEHVHFGKRVAPSSDFSAAPRREHRCTVLEFQGVPDYSLDDTPQEYPLFGSSDTRHPALHVVNSAGNSTNVFLYQGHEILNEKPSLNGLPSARGGDSQTLLVRLLDEASQLELELSYTLYAEHDVVARSAAIRNVGDANVQLKKAMSSTLDLPQGDYELLHFGGSWAREFDQRRMDLPHGRFVVESTRGTSSNTHSPFWALMSQGANEQQGDVYATTLLYSGNFSISTEQSEFEAVRVCAGINPFNFQWQLEPQQVFTTPESLQVYSASGLGGMSQVWHYFIQQKISPVQFQDAPRPTYLNSWEAAYFDVNHDMVLNLADEARSMGVEMLVLDDGWFQGRDDDSSSLGDWFSDTKKFPQGVEETARQVKAKGLKFGLWFEPEMVNRESDLYRQHPDWLIQVPNRALSTGRSQYVLDLSNADVVEYLYERLDSFLSCGSIDYVKWDMNRIMSEVGSLSLPVERQLELSHRYMLGLYDLVERITEKYNHVLFENCASGGNRFDLGMLRYMSQGWVSDMCDPVGRLSVINGASHLFPLSTLASYIGPVPNHQNGRLTSIKTRAEVGFFAAARGLSLNQTDLNVDKAELQQAVELYKATAQDVAAGAFHRLKYTNNEVCWQLISQDKQRVYVGYYHILSGPNMPYRRAKLIGLESDSQYKLQSSDQTFKGDALMNLGVDLPYVANIYLGPNDDPNGIINRMPAGDFSSSLIVFERI